ncbi:hypothetical protein DQ384_36510 [Sphaerisporangium album]|uniref:Uncharacterized protein n=2 Tax=Sphaerisporangium album TaxID=509200 RepID=A0A367ESU5_9ACTN|nr:hypothetical protein DQ384_36510 [Sphaerisporangium album]
MLLNALGFRWEQTPQTSGEWIMPGTTLVPPHADVIRHVQQHLAKAGIKSCIDIAWTPPHQEAATARRVLPPPAGYHLDDLQAGDLVRYAEPSGTHYWARIGRTHNCTAEAFWGPHPWTYTRLWPARLLEVRRTGPQNTAAPAIFLAPPFPTTNRRPASRKGRRNAH